MYFSDVQCLTYQEGEEVLRNYIWRKRDIWFKNLHENKMTEKAIYGLEKTCDLLIAELKT